MTSNWIKTGAKFKKIELIITYILIFFAIFVYPKTGIGYSPLTIIETIQIPLFIKVFLVIMAFLICIMDFLISV